MHTHVSNINCTNATETFPLDYVMINYTGELTVNDSRLLDIGS